MLTVYAHGHHRDEGLFPKSDVAGRFTTGIVLLCQPEADQVSDARKCVHDLGLSDACVKSTADP